MRLTLKGNDIAPKTAKYISINQFVIMRIFSLPKIRFYYRNNSIFSFEFNSKMECNLLFRTIALLNRFGMRYENFTCIYLDSSSPMRNFHKIVQRQTVRKIDRVLCGPIMFVAIKIANMLVDTGTSISVDC